MKINIHFLDSDFFKDKIPSFYEITNSLLTIDWENNVLPRTGEIFKFQTLIPRYILEMMSAEERSILFSCINEATIVRAGWDEEMLYFVDIKFCRENTQTYPLSSLRRVVIKTPELADYSFNIEWNADIFPHIGDKLCFDSFLTNKEFNRFLLFFVLNIHRISQRTGMPLLHIQECETIIDNFIARCKCINCEYSKEKKELPKAVNCEHVTNSCYSGWLEENYAKKEVREMLEIILQDAKEFLCLYAKDCVIKDTKWKKDKDITIVELTVLKEY